MRGAALDFIHNGQTTGPVADALMQTNGDLGILRPFVGGDGHTYVTLNQGGTARNFRMGTQLPNGMVLNAPATLRKNEWEMLDTVVLKSARERLRAWADLRAANTYGGFNGMAKTVLEHQTMADHGAADLDMDGLTESTRDRPVYNLLGLPLPIVHADFWFSSRELMVSRNSGTPIDTTMAEQCGRRVAEKIERLTIGTLANFAYGGHNVYGYTNFPDRITKTDVTSPLAGGWTPNQLVLDVLDMIDSLNDLNFFGPFMLYHSTDWSQYMEEDYSAAKGDNTLRERLMKIDQVQDVRRLDFLTSTFTILLVQMTSDVARAVNGMEVTTVQWDEKGGMKKNFKVMGIQVPQIRSNADGVTGIAHGTTS